MQPETMPIDPSGFSAVPRGRDGDAALYQFVVAEARLADESRYDEWEALWDDEEAKYWVPIDPDSDPGRTVSYINDNRRRIRSRMAQLKSGSRHSQVPPSIMRRLLSNFEFDHGDDGVATVRANFLLIEFRDHQTLWAGQYVYRIRTDHPQGLRLLEKQVRLVNRSGAIPTLAFII